MPTMPTARPVSADDGLRVNLAGANDALLDADQARALAAELFAAADLIGSSPRCPAWCQLDHEDERVKGWTDSDRVVHERVLADVPTARGLVRVAVQVFDGPAGRESAVGLVTGDVEGGMTPQQMRALAEALGLAAQLAAQTA